MAQGRIVGIFVSKRATALPVSVTEVRAAAGRGLEGDRYFVWTGTFSDSDPKGPGREITLIERESLDYLKVEHGIGLSGEEARRNVVTEGVRLNDLVGRRFMVGEVSLEGVRLCHPCDHLEELTGKELLGPLKNRGGLRATILTDGTIKVGDPIVLDGS